MAKKKQEAKLKEPVRIRFKQLANGNQSIYLDYYTGDVILWNENKIMSVSSGHLTIKLSNFLIDIIKIAECFVYKINTWREDKFERSVANGTETVFVTLRFCVVRKQLKATLKPNAAGVQLPPHYYRNG